MERLDEFLAEHRNLDITREGARMTVHGSVPSGFDVAMVDDGHEATIWAHGWHSHYSNPEEAAATFMWLLTPATRIALMMGGKNILSWKLQWEEDGKWVSGDRGVAFLTFLYPFRRHEVILQNDLIAGKQVYTEP